MSYYPLTTPRHGLPGDREMGQCRDRVYNGPFPSPQPYPSGINMNGAMNLSSFRQPSACGHGYPTITCTKKPMDADSQPNRAYATGTYRRYDLDRPLHQGRINHAVAPVPASHQRSQNIQARAILNLQTEVGNLRHELNDLRDYVMEDSSSSESDPTDDLDAVSNDSDESNRFEAHPSWFTHRSFTPPVSTTPAAPGRCGGCTGLIDLNVRTSGRCQGCEHIVDYTDLSGLNQPISPPVRHPQRPFIDLYGDLCQTRCRMNELREEARMPGYKCIRGQVDSLTDRLEGSINQGLARLRDILCAGLRADNEKLSEALYQDFKLPRSTPTAAAGPSGTQSGTQGGDGSPSSTASVSSLADVGELALDSQQNTNDPGTSASHDGYQSDDEHSYSTQQKTELESYSGEF